MLVCMITRMHRSALLLIACALTACTTDAPSPSTEDDLFCGGIAAIPCPEGFVCQYDGDYPDAGGTCIPE